MSVCSFAREHRRIGVLMGISNSRSDGRGLSQLLNLKEMYENLLWAKAGRMVSEAVFLALFLVMIEGYGHLVMPVGCCLFLDRGRVVCNAALEVEMDSMAGAQLK